jgi:hypothetical protein
MLSIEIRISSSPFFKYSADVLPCDCWTVGAYSRGPPFSYIPPGVWSTFQRMNGWITCGWKPGRIPQAQRSANILHPFFLLRLFLLVLIINHKARVRPIKSTDYDYSWAIWRLSVNLSPCNFFFIQWFCICRTNVDQSQFRTSQPCLWENKE